MLKKWLLSSEAAQLIGGSSCDLMHLREAGNLRFEKVGNAFLYRREDVRREASKRRTRKKPTR